MKRRGPSNKTEPAKRPLFKERHRSFRAGRGKRNRKRFLFKHLNERPHAANIEVESKRLPIGDEEGTTRRFEEYRASSKDTVGNTHGTGRPTRKTVRKRRLDRFPYVRLLRAYLAAKAAVLDRTSLDVRRRNLLRVFRILLDLRRDRTIDTLDPRKFGKTEIDSLMLWTRTRKTSYSAKLWTAIEDFLLFNDNDIVKRLEAKVQWRRPDPTYKPGPVKDEHWLNEAMTRLDVVAGWRGNAAKFITAFMFGTGLRPGELRLADVADLDTEHWIFKVMHPKKVPGAVVGAELAIYADTRDRVLDYLTAREKRMRELGHDPKKVTALVPSERGRHYSEAGFRNLRVDAFRVAGIEGDYRALRRTHEQVLMDRLEFHGHKEGSVIEIAAKRLRHSVQTAVKHYADLRTARGQKAAQEAWEAPIVRLKDGV